MDAAPPFVPADMLARTVGAGLPRDKYVPTNKIAGYAPTVWSSTRALGKAPLLQIRFARRYRMRLSDCTLALPCPLIVTMRLIPIVVALSFGLTSVRAEFRASAVKIDISPSTPQWLMGYGARKSTGVRDPIHHRIAALDDGSTQVFIVASDLCLFSPTVYDEVTAELKKQMGIEPVQVWWTVTHSHSTPEVGPPGMYDVLLKGRSEHPWDREYCEFVKSKFIEGIRQAREQLAPARIAIGTGMSRANINRRARDADGKISLGLNPDGPTDRQIGLIRLERPDGISHRTDRELRDARHGARPAMLQISGDGPGNRHLVRGGENRRADALHQRRRGKSRSHLYGAGTRAFAYRRVPRAAR